jgi:hypothetical protein
VDADDIVDELSESNNIVSYEYFIPSNSTRNLYPYNFAIVHNQQVRLSFQNTDVQIDERKFELELDTVNTFDSGFKQQYTITAAVLASQQVNLPAADTAVYYWRTRFAEPGENESGEWAVHSFTYIVNGPEGWAQAHFPQFESNENAGLVQDPILRRLRYEETISDIAIKTFSAAAAKPADSVSVKINGAEFNLVQEGDACRNNTINLIAFDRKSNQPYAGIYFKWYDLLYSYGGRRLLCGREPYVINSFTPEELVTGNQDDLIQYIDNIHAGDSVVLFNIGDAGYPQWPAAARDKLAEVGISLAQLTSLQEGEPLVIFGRKGSAEGTAKIFRAAASEPALIVSETIAGRYTSGVMSSAVIGPAQHWNKLIFQTGEKESTDDVSISVVGISPEGQQDTLMLAASSGEDLSFIDAQAYPFLKILFQTGDDINLTPVQLRKWLVLYETVPEGLVFYRGPSDLQIVEPLF